MITLQFSIILESKGVGGEIFLENLSLENLSVFKF